MLIKHQMLVKHQLWYSCFARVYILWVSSMNFFRMHGVTSSWKVQPNNKWVTNLLTSVKSLDIFKYIFLNANVWTSLKIPLKFIPKVRINNIPALDQIMAWRRPGDKPLCEPMMGNSLTHICVTRPQWVNTLWNQYGNYWWPVVWFSIKMPSYQYKDSHYKDEMGYLYKWNFYLGKMTCFHQIRGSIKCRNISNHFVIAGKPMPKSSPM